MKRVIIVGAGLFGSMAARIADAAGHEVTVIDNGNAWSASKASGCVIAPSWLTALPKDRILLGFAILSDFMTVHELPLQSNLLKTFHAHRVALEDVLVKPDLDVRVTQVTERGQVQTTAGEYKADAVLVAAGVGCNALIPGMPPIRALWGSSLHIPTPPGPAGMLQPRIHVYAPYRQAVMFKSGPRMVWMGDGTALVAKSWELRREEVAQRLKERAGKFFELDTKTAKVISGARPYVEGHKAGYFAKLGPRLWVSTGGAKNGTLLAALQAAEFVKAIGK